MKPSPNYQSFGRNAFMKSPYWQRLSAVARERFEILSQVFHFKVNSYVLEELIDWSAPEDDPIYRLIFPQESMLAPEDYAWLRNAHRLPLPKAQWPSITERLRAQAAPAGVSHPACYARLDGELIDGLYHNYTHQLNLFADPAVRTCHAYCSYCFRWNLFQTSEAPPSFRYQDPQTPVPYLMAHPEITDAVFTGADPLVMSARKLKTYLQPLLEVESLQNIRIHSKALSYWPYRFTTDADADGLLEVFAMVAKAGKQLSLMAHLSHPRELSTPMVREAVGRIRDTGTQIRSHGPLIRGVNDTAETWSELWTQQLGLGMIPTAMFMECGQNPQRAFGVTLARGLQIFQEAQAQTTGLARGVQGPLFVDQPLRVALTGTVEIAQQRYFVLKPQQVPPGMQPCTDLKLLPWDEHRMDPGDLMQLFDLP